MDQDHQDLAQFQYQSPIIYYSSSLFASTSFNTCVCDIHTYIPYLPFFSLNADFYSSMRMEEKNVNEKDAGWLRTRRWMDGWMDGFSKGRMGWEDR